MAQITCLVCSGRGVVFTHGLVDGPVDVGVYGFTLLGRVSLNDLLFALWHTDFNFVIVVLDVLVDSTLLCL